MRPFCLAMMVYLALPGIAPAAASDADALRRFGILGRLALDCGSPYSQNNPQQIYAVSQWGGATRTLMLQQGDATLSLRNVRMLASDLLRFDEIGRSSNLTITIVKIDGKFRNWDSTRADGTVLITDGRFSDSGKPTTALNFCGD